MDIPNGYRRTEPKDGFVEDGVVPIDRYGGRAACDYCCTGVYSGLPGGACENCMNTGLKYPQFDADPPCTDCEDTGITKQTERSCTCAAGDEYREAAYIFGEQGEDDIVEAMIESLRDPFPLTMLSVSGGIDRWREIMRTAYRAAISAKQVTP